MTTAMRTVRFLPVGSHRDLFTSRSPELLGAGPAGTGKTFTIAWRLHTVAMRYPGVRVLMTRKDLESLKPAALTTYVNGVMPHLYGVYPFGGNKFTPAEYRYPNGSVIQVNGLDRPDKVKSAEYDVIYVNEATEITESTWEMLKSRLRNGAMPYQQIIGDANPSGPRHWLKQRCDRGQTRLITSTHKDNPAYWDERAQAWTKAGHQYVQENLATLTGLAYKRLYQGVWAAAEGLVYAEFDPARHVRDTDVTGWRTVLGVDVGTRNPTGILVAHVSGDGRIHVSDELYRRGMSSTDIIAAVERYADAHDPDAIYIDPSAKGYIDDLHRDGYPAVAAVNDVLVGIQRVHGAFQDGMTISPACINLIDELGMYAYPDNPKIETDKPIKDHDHLADALRYLCMGVTEPAVNLQEFYEQWAS